MTEFSSNYSFSPNGVQGGVEAKQKILAAILSAGINGNAEQVQGGYVGNASPYVGAEIGPLSLNATRNMGGFVDNQGNAYESDPYNSYGARINSNAGDLNFGLGAEKSPYGVNYNAGASMPAFGGNISGSVSRSNPTYGDPNTNAMLQYKRKF